MQYLPGDLAQLQVDDEANRRRQAQAQALQQAGFNPVQGGNSLLSLLTSVMSTVRGGQMMSEADAKASEIMAKRFEAQNAADMAKAEAEAAKDARDWQREQDKITLRASTEAKYREAPRIDPNSPEGIAAQIAIANGKRPTGGGGPATEKGWSIMDTPQGMMRVNSLTGAVEPLNVGGNPLMGKAGAPDKPKEGDPKAAAAAQAREILATLEQQIPASGPIDGRLPTPGAQGFDRAVAQLVNPFQTLTRIPGQGAQSDAELKRLMDSFPSVTNYESVNKESIANLRSYLDKIQGMQGQEAQPAAPQAPAAGQPTQTATNPQTGQKIGLINGQWVPI